MKDDNTAEVERMIVLERGMERVLGEYFADNGVTQEAAAVMLASAIGRLLSDNTGTEEERVRNLSVIAAVVESFVQPTVDEPTH